MYFFICDTIMSKRWSTWVETRNNGPWSQGQKAKYTQSNVKKFSTLCKAWGACNPSLFVIFSLSVVEIRLYNRYYRKYYSLLLPCAYHTLKIKVLWLYEEVKVWCSVWTCDWNIKEPLQTIKSKPCHQEKNSDTKINRVRKTLECLHSP